MSYDPVRGVWGQVNWIGIRERPICPHRLVVIQSFRASDSVRQMHALLDKLEENRFLGEALVYPWLC